MSDPAQLAYERARQLILMARDQQAESLRLSGPETKELRRIPDEISELKHLKSLILGWVAQDGIERDTACQQISDLSPLGSLYSLQSLNLCFCEQISDLSLLESLSSLKSVNLSLCRQISDLSPLESLSSLQSLDLSYCRQISDLSPLGALSSLQSLELSYCEQVSDFSPLGSLSSLQSLSLSGCSQALGEFGPLFFALPQLQDLFLFETQFADLPLAVCGENFFANVIDEVRAHFADLQAGAEPDAEVKVLILGNGHAGKTQFTRRLLGLPFDPAIPSTHGIQVHTLEKDWIDGGGEMRLNLWDFGGQEVYHGSHTLFVEGQAIFLLLWTPELENSDAFLEGSLEMRNRRLPYWLDYLRCFAGTQSPVLVIQSQCDSAGQRQRSLSESMVRKHGSSFASIQLMECSAKTELGRGLVEAQIREGVRDCLAQRPLPPVGLGRARVRGRLRQMLAADQELPAAERRHRVLTRPEFDAICADEGGISDTEAFLDYLHHSGVVFYRHGLFDGRIVLDQNWALEAVYALFDRKRVLPLYRGYGRFTQEELSTLIWQDYSQDEQKPFLGMMESCGICFSLDPRHEQVEDREYIALELLPLRSRAHEELLSGRIPSGRPDAQIRAQYPFLHDGLMRQFLSRIGKKAGRAAVYWRYGCWFYEQVNQSRILIEAHWDDDERSQSGYIHFQAWGGNAQQLVEAMLQCLEETPMGAKPEIRSDFSGGSAEAVAPRFLGEKEFRWEDAKPAVAAQPVEAVKKV